jgi:hypothetical protein
MAAATVLVVACSVIIGLDMAFESAQQRSVRRANADYVRPYLRAAETGDPAAEYLYGQLLQNGDHIHQDVEAGVSWYRKAAGQGYLEAQVSLAYMYFAGDEVRQDYGEAAKWFRKAAEQGDVEAMNGLAWILVTDAGLLDAKEGLSWATKAVKGKPGAADVLDTLACAYAANGDFGAAVKTEQQALEATKDSEVRENLQEMIGAFQKKMTYIDYRKAKGK